MSARSRLGAGIVVACASAAIVAQTVPPAPTSTVVPRTERLSMQRAALEESLARVVAFGHRDEFAAGLRALQARKPEAGPADAEPSKEGDEWRLVARGWLPRMAIDHWLEWHLPAPGQTDARAVDFSLSGHPFQVIVDVERQLRAHEIEFVLVLFPSRLQLYPELVDASLAPPADPAFGGMVGATTEFLLALNGAGVETLDLAPAFASARADGGPEVGEIYLQRNKHWTPRAAELAASLVAQRLQTQSWYAPGSASEGKAFQTLRRVVDIGGAAGGQAPDTTPEKLALNQVRQLGARVNPADVRRSPIVLLGDSFAKFYADLGGGFADQLRRFTGHPIDALTPMGGGELQCRQQLARRGDGLRGKKVVVWLLQEDNLLPSAQWKTVDLFEE